MAVYAEHSVLIINATNDGMGQSPVAIGGGVYEVQLSTDPPNLLEDANIGDILTDHVGNQYKIEDWQNVSFLSTGTPTKSASLGFPLKDAYIYIGDAIYVKVSFITTNVLPAYHPDDEWTYGFGGAKITWVENESGETASALGKYQPTVSWRALISNSQPLQQSFHYKVNLYSEGDQLSINDGLIKGGYFFVDFSGNIFQIKDYLKIEDAWEIVLYNINEVDQQPYLGAGYVYESKYRAYGLVQAPIARLDASARDRIQNSTNSINWNWRGVSLTAENETIDNVTSLTIGTGLQVQKNTPASYTIAGGNQSTQQLILSDDSALTTLKTSSSVRILNSQENNGFYSVASYQQAFAEAIVYASIVAAENKNTPANTASIYIENSSSISLPGESLSVYIENAQPILSEVPPVSIYIDLPRMIDQYYAFDVYFANISQAGQLVVDYIITDSVGKKYKIVGFYNPANIAQNETNSLCQEGWVVKLQYITHAILPAQDSDYNSTLTAPNLGYSFTVYFENMSLSSEVAVNQVITDSATNEYRITGFFNPSNPSQNETNSSCQEGWTLKVVYVTVDTVPANDTDYNSQILVSAPVNEGYSFTVYFENMSLASEVAVGQIVTDSIANQYTITGFFNPSNPSQDETNSSCQEGWTLEVAYITTDTSPEDDVDYESQILLSEATNDGYTAKIVLQNPAQLPQVLIGEILTDSVSNKYTITGYYNPENIAQNHTNSSFQDNWLLSLTFITNDVMPTISLDYSAIVGNTYFGVIVTLSDPLPSATIDGKLIILDDGWQGGETVTLVGSSSTTSAFESFDNLSTQIDDVNNIFTVTHGSYLPGTLLVMIGGIINDKGTHYFEEDPATGQIRFIVAPTLDDAPIVAQYQYTTV